MFEEFKKKTSNIINKTSDIVYKKTKETINAYQEYHDREREKLPEHIIFKIDNTIRKSSITTALKGELVNGRVSIYESKLGGFPYLPSDMEMPKDKDGNEMRLLVQINCEDLKDIPYFPHKGMLQIYLSRNSVYGLNKDNHYDQDWFKVIYHDTIDKNIKEKDVMKKTLLNELEDFPLRHECLIYFTPFYDYINSRDYRYLNMFREYVNKEPLNYKNFTNEEIYNMVSSNDRYNTQIGGFPNFIYNDPRTINDKCDILLFQLLTDGKNVVLKNKGIINFFISYDDLINKKFDKVFYTWDAK